jgi:hypothetical protein
MLLSIYPEGYRKAIIISMQYSTKSKIMDFKKTEEGKIV